MVARHLSKPEAMAGRKGHKRPLPQPLPAGRVVQTEGERAAQDAAMPKAQGKKKWWKNKRSLLRLIKHKREKQNEMWAKIGSDPHEGKPMMQWTPSGQFLKRAEKWLLARYAAFVLQNCLLILRYWSPQVCFVANKFGEGVHSSARYACLVLQSEALPQQVMNRVTSLRRHLYARAIREHESAAAVEQTVSSEWDEDRSFAVSARLRTFLETKLKPEIENGRFPKTNLQRDFHPQWDEDWKEPMLCCQRTLHANVTGGCIHFTPRWSDLVSKLRLATSDNSCSIVMVHAGTACHTCSASHSSASA